ncbi:MAG TPA: hypothetical protein VGF95_07990 [Solirubrobacteraceae bacterium]
MRFWGIDPDLDRPRLQAMRAAPPALAKDSGARRRVFGAALGQWDALLAASASVVPAASPILLFYALSQAGRAVCAAHTSGQPWQSRGHGLSIGNLGKPLGETLVRPEGGSDSSFAMFCKALKASPLSESTTLGALWAANMKLESVEGLGLGMPGALELSVIAPSYMGGPSLHAQLGGDLAANLPADSAAAAAEVGERLHEYPGAATGLVVNTQGTSITPQGTEPRVEISWRDSNGKPVPIDQIAPDEGNFLRPQLNQAGDTLPALALWWATLLTLSSLARYHPEQWNDALDRDKAVTAVPIEEALNIGREMLPWLLITALSQ